MNKNLILGALLCACVMSGQNPTTPNIHLNIPYLNAPGWNVLLNDNFSALDLYLSGNQGTSSLLFTMQSSAATPPAGRVRLYMNSDGFLHVKDANGNDYALGSGGGGGSAAWGSITGTLSSQTDLQNALNAKQATGNYLIGLSGDVTATGPGTASATLATVNSNVGTCGDATHVGRVTLDAKGRTTACTPVAITTAGVGTVTSFAAPSGSWPTWLVPTVTNSTSTPSLAVAASILPAALLPVGSTSAFGAVKCDGTTITCTAGVIAATGAGGSFYQTFQSNGTPVAQRAKFNMAAGANITITPTDNGSDTTTFTVAASGAGTNNWTSGSGVPTANCTVGSGVYLYFDTAFTNPGMPIYYCSATNIWTQGVNLGGSGCLAFTAGTLDIVTACLPQKTLANDMSALNRFGAIAGMGSAPTRTNVTGTVAVNAGSTNASGTITSSTSGTVLFTFTMAGVTFATRPVCMFRDETTIADIVGTTQSTPPTTSALTVTGTTASGDIISYICIGH